MAEMTGGELRVLCLANEDIRFVFGLPCPEVDPILAKLEEYDIRFVPARHEGGSVVAITAQHRHGLVQARDPPRGRHAGDRRGIRP
jgi:thiamine pyrophosphate-dependent acetolactate synthase large subunit-like protein